MKGLRLRAGLTQQDLARRLDVPQSWVSNIESGHRRLGLLEATHVCEAVGCTLGDLIDGIEYRMRDGGPLLG